MHPREGLRRRTLADVVGEQLALGRERGDLLSVALQCLPGDRPAVAARQCENHEPGGARAPQLFLMKLIEPFDSTIAHCTSSSDEICCCRISSAISSSVMRSRFR